MKKLICIMAFIGIAHYVSAKLIYPIHAEMVDSVVIRTVNWSILFETPFGVERKAFDDLYEFLSLNQEFQKSEGLRIDSIKITDELSKFIFCTMINALPIHEKNPNPLPDKILKKGKGFNQPNRGILYNLDWGQNGETLEIRGQIKIYKKNGAVIVGYMSHHLLDIFNERYSASTLSEFINDYIDWKFNGPKKYLLDAIDYDYISREDMITPDSVIVYNKSETHSWQKFATLDTETTAAMIDIISSESNLSDKLAFYPSMKIEFYVGGLRNPIYISGNYIKEYNNLYKISYNIEAYIYSKIEKDKYPR